MYTQHGGNLDAAERQFGIPKELIIDFSGNVNPLGAPGAALRAIVENASAVTRYPDVEYRALRQGISQYTGVAARHIIPGNGSTELISAFIRTISPKSAVIISPAYSEYERAINLSGGEVQLFPLHEEDDFQLRVDELVTAAKNAQLLVICNPNNPTGAAITTKTLETLLFACPDTYVMVDETYAEFSTEPISSAGLIEMYPNLFTVRGTSKFFAVPGLRLGYAMCANEDVRNEVLEKKDPWSVNILSMMAGEAIFSGTDEMGEYITRTKELVSGQMAFFYKAGIGGLKLYNSRSNFILAKILANGVTAKDIADELLKKSNILIRNAASFPYLNESYIRFCMRLPVENARLAEGLSEILRR